MDINGKIESVLVRTFIYKWGNCPLTHWITADWAFFDGKPMVLESTVTMDPSHSCRMIRMHGQGVADVCVFSWFQRLVPSPLDVGCFESEMFSLTLRTCRWCFQLFPSLSEVGLKPAKTTRCLAVSKSHWHSPHFFPWEHHSIGEETPPGHRHSHLYTQRSESLLWQTSVAPGHVHSQRQLSNASAMLQHVKIGCFKVESLSWRRLEDGGNEHLKCNLVTCRWWCFGHWGSLGWDVEVMTRSATYRVERPTSSVFASGALSSARTRWELKEQPGK